MKSIQKTRDFNPFNRVQVEAPNTNVFDLSHDAKLTTDMGKLIPVLFQETLPGDTFTITPEMLVRFAPMTFPIMHRIDATIHFFYVPNRINWKNWEKFLAGEKLAGEYYSPPYVVGKPVMSEDLPVEPGSFWDYMGLPNTDNMQQAVDAFPLLAYLRIVNEYYQDQNNDSRYQGLRDLLVTLTEKQGGEITADDMGLPAWQDFELFNRAWEHDYFTSVLPWAQKGDSVNIPLALAELTGTSVAYQATDIDGDPLTGDLTADTGNIIIPPDVLTFIRGEVTIPGGQSALEGTINQLRTAMQLQKFLETNARSGTRYNELIRAHFNEDVGDARINRPEYIGGIKNNVMISEVLQTSATDGGSALGEYAGYGNAVVSGNRITYHTPEHGYIVGMLSIIPKTAYFQGIPRKFTKFDYLDYYWPHFAHIGEQAVLNREVYYDEALTDNNDTFGYIPRYSEYKYNPSRVHGDFRTSLLDFHLARKFDTRPQLNQDFIYCKPADQKRIFAVTDPDVNSLYAHIFFDIKAKRKIPFFTNPGGI